MAGEEAPLEGTPGSAQVEEAHPLLGDAVGDPHPAVVGVVDLDVRGDLDGVLLGEGKLPVARVA